MKNLNDSLSRTCNRCDVNGAVKMLESGRMTLHLNLSVWALNGSFLFYFYLFCYVRYNSRSIDCVTKQNYTLLDVAF